MNSEIKVIIPPNFGFLDPLCRFGPNDRELLVIDYSYNYHIDNRPYILLFNTNKEKFDEKIFSDVIERIFVKRLEKYLEV